MSRARWIKSSIHVRYVPPSLPRHQAYTCTAVNEYCSGYGKVAAIEDLDPDFLMYVFPKPKYPTGEQILLLGTRLGKFQLSILFRGPICVPLIVGTDGQW